MAFTSKINGTPHEVDVDGDRTEVPELHGLTRPDLVLLNDNDLAYAKIRLDEKSLATAIAHLADISDPRARSQRAPPRAAGG